ncbi:MAG: response regulator [Candidatus Nanopelagicales bacterium]|nr:response regulator [Candidatus Nanopelagicales bacterium]
MSEATTRVIVAEDEAVIRMDLVEMLKELGYDVVAEAFNGERAVELVREHRPDLAFLDIAMPVRDGLSAAEEISRDNLCAVVMVTAFSQRDVAMKAAEAGAVGYVVKPFTMADLEPSIALALARWRQIQDLQGQVEALGDRAKAREEVERAKTVLQERFGLSEPEAFSWLRKAAMDRRVTLSEAATALLSGQVTP